MSWCEIPGHRKYEAHPDGRFRHSETHVEIKQSRHLISKKNGGGFSGYVTVWVDGKHRKSHRLIAMTFLDNKLKKRFVNHIDGDKSNNHCANLEWSTPCENSQHALRIGRIRAALPRILKNTTGSMVKRGELNPRTRISDSAVLEIRDKYRSGNYLIKELAAYYALSEKYVSQIARGYVRGGA